MKTRQLQNKPNCDQTLQLITQKCTPRNGSHARRHQAPAQHLCPPDPVGWAGEPSISWIPACPQPSTAQRETFSGGFIRADLTLHTKRTQRNLTSGFKQNAHLFKGMYENAFTVNKNKQTKATALCITFLCPTASSSTNRIRKNKLCMANACHIT